jgi:hypothetical protein
MRMIGKPGSKVRTHPTGIFTEQALSTKCRAAAQRLRGLEGPQAMFSSSIISAKSVILAYADRWGDGVHYNAPY